jgi:hypothetical protein
LKKQRTAAVYVGFFAVLNTIKARNARTADAVFIAMAGIAISMVCAGLSDWAERVA